MRYLLILLIVAGAGGLVWYALDVGGGAATDKTAAVPQGLSPEPGARGAMPVAKAAEEIQLVAVPAPDVDTASNDVPAASSSSTLAGRRILEGTLTDRFGEPVSGERVFLLSAVQSHPQNKADVVGYVTAVSSRKGKFSLSVPDEGPWRVGIGPPGTPRMPPSEPRVVSGTTYVDVVVSGAAKLRIAFDEVPAGDAPLALEVLTLVEPGAGANPPGRADGRRGNRGGRGNRGAAPRRGTGGGGGATRGGEGGGGGGPAPNDSGGRRRGGADPGATKDDGVRAGGVNNRDARAPLSVTTGVLARPAQDTGTPTLRPAAPAGRRDRGGRNGARAQEPKDPPEQDVVPLGAPIEQWRPGRKHDLTREERAAGVFEIGGLPVGPVHRLVLRVGDERFDGAARFTLLADAVTEVRVFPITAGSSSLSYIVQSKPLAPGESPAGVHWRD